MKLSIKPLFIILLFTISFTTKAQDIIVKNDKSETKAKVTEITEHTIKYKKWDNLNGPLYNISKEDVFMIIYENGQREILKKDTKKINETVTGTSLQQNIQTESTSLQNQDFNKAQLGIDTALDYENIKIKYKPTRFLYWFESPPTTLGVQQEIRLVKNLLNIGTSVDFFFVKGGGYTQTLTTIYVAPYLPLNRTLKEYEKQDLGLFLYGKVGLAGMTIVFNGKTTSTLGLAIGIGADYLITKNLGISISGFKFKDSDLLFQGGICINVL